jgi:hypothetical protein
MRVGYLNEAYAIIVDTPGKITGLTDVEFAVINAATGTPVSGSPLSATEIGSTGTYRASWTPTVVGGYLIEVSSAAQGVSDVSGVVRVEEKSATDVSNEIAGLENLSGTDVWSVASRTLTDKTGFELTASERTAIATAVENSILNEGDGRAVLNAIVGAIGNTNVNEVALVAAIRTDLERNGGLLETMDNKLDTLQSSISAGSQPIFRIIN